MKIASFDIRNAVAVALCALTTIAVSLPGFAADHQHGAHQHGVSNLNLVIDGQRLELELESPGSDIVGFEHPPATDADRKAIAGAAGLLRDGGSLFVTAAAAGCKLQSAEIESPGVEKGDEHHGHDHGKEKHKQDNPGAGKETHSEFHAHYRFVCDHPERLTHIDVGFFKAFVQARELEVQAVTPEKQFRRELTPGNARLILQR
jgi:hypothetical protein